MTAQGSRTLALLVFGAALTVLFLGFAIAQGIGKPDVPDGDVALVEDVPGDAGAISRAGLTQAVEELEEESGVVGSKPTSAQAKALQEQVLAGLLEKAWLEGEIAEKGISVTDEQVGERLQELKEKQFDAEGLFRRFLVEADLTVADVKDEMRHELVLAAFKERNEQEAPVPSREAIEAMYEERKEGLTTPETRDLRIVVSKDLRTAEKAHEALSKAGSAEDWGEAYREYDSDSVVSSEGAVRREVWEGWLEGPLRAAVFNASVGQLEGPVKDSDGYAVFEVTRLHPEEVEDISTVEDEYRAELKMESDRKYSEEVASSFYGSWVPRTICAPPLVIPYCGNYEGDPHPGVDPACYEADPKGGLPKEGCPAPVNQRAVILPGSVTPLLLEGRPLLQRPHSVGHNPVQDSF